MRTLYIKSPKNRSFVNLKKYTLSEMLEHTQRAHISYFNKKINHHGNKRVHVRKRH